MMSTRAQTDDGSFQSRIEKFLKITGSCMVIETIFYMPNSFRQTILVNSNHISFLKPNDALLDLMNIMFRIDVDKVAPIREFKAINFLSPYKTFFTSTLFYESILMSARMSAFDYL